MKITIINNKWLHISHITTEINEALDLHFSVYDPDFKYIKDACVQSWDGVYHKYNKYRQRLARGFLQELILWCKINGVPYDIVDNRPPPAYPMYTKDDVKDDILPGIRLFEHQLEAIRACIDNEVGIIFQHTGSGKTEVMCAIAKLMRCPTVIVAEERVVIDQIKNRLELRDVINDVGVFYAGKAPAGQLVCVGSIASIVSPSKTPMRAPNESAEKYEAKLKALATRISNAKRYQELVFNCFLLMIDECDRCSNAQYRKLILQYSNARRIYGFTGTMPDKEDEPIRYMNLKEVLGNVIVRTNRKELERIGKIIPVKYVMFVYGNLKHKNNSAAFDVAVKKWINENDDFHKKVIEIVNAFPNDNFLILVESISLGEKLKSIIPGSHFIHGQTSQKERAETLKNFSTRKLRVLIGSKILKRGLDIPGGIDNLILLASTRKDSELEQKVGRALRVNERGWARIFDFLYVCNKYLYKHSRARLRRMIEMGYTTTVNTSLGPVDGNKFIKNSVKYLK